MTQPDRRYVQLENFAGPNAVWSVFQTMEKPDPGQPTGPFRARECRRAGSRLPGGSGARPWRRAELEQRTS